MGIARHGAAFGFKAVRNEAQVVATGARVGADRLPRAIRRVPVVVEDADQGVEHHATVPRPMAASFVPEQQRRRPLACGLQVQNVDDDARQRDAGALGVGLWNVGTAGCLVRLGDGSAAILSNNHVLAAENRGLKGKDRILQPGDAAFAADLHVATLADFVALRPSPANARPARGNVVFNAVDAAIAQLEAGVDPAPGFLPARAVPGPMGVAAPRVGMTVFKVGRTTGLTRGTITAVATVVGPIGYDPGPCWFRGQIEVVGDGGGLFSDHGDSGSAIVGTTGEVVGLLYAGNGTQSYACPIETVLTALNCTLL